MVWTTVLAALCAGLAADCSHQIGSVGTATASMDTALLTPVNALRMQLEFTASFCMVCTWGAQQYYVHKHTVCMYFDPFHCILLAFIHVHNHSIFLLSCSIHFERHWYANTVRLPFVGGPQQWNGIHHGHGSDQLCLGGPCTWHTLLCLCQSGHLWRIWSVHWEGVLQHNSCWVRWMSETW